MVDTVRAATDNASLIGCSSSGEFTEENVEHGSVAVGLIASDDIKFATAIADGVKEDPERAVRTVANKLPLKMGNYPHLSAIFLIDGLAGVGRELKMIELKKEINALLEELGNPTLSHYRQINSGRWHDLKPFGKQNQHQAPEWVVNLTKSGKGPGYKIAGEQ